MKVVYIAGPFSGPDAWTVERNIRRAEELAYEVSCLGASPMCPHSNTRFFNGTHTYEFWIAATSALLSKCDAVIFTPDWHKSSGARKEHEQALTEGTPVFYDLRALNIWLQTGLYSSGLTPPLHGG